MVALRIVVFWFVLRYSLPKSKVLVRSEPIFFLAVYSLDYVKC